VGGVARREKNGTCAHAPRSDVFRRTYSSIRRHRDEDLSLAYLASPWTGDRDLLAGVADEYLVAGDMMLAHYREQTTFELAKEVAKKQIR
jgi:hypothetical protein